MKTWTRVSPLSLADGEFDPRGRIFLGDNGQQFDLSSVTLCHTGVDTVRQLYRGTPNPAALKRIEAAGAQRQETVMVMGNEWALKRMGKNSGYRWGLFDNEWGLVVLYGSQYQQLDGGGSHLKIEVSPRLCGNYPPVNVQGTLDSIARELLNDWAPAGVAIHLAADIQGWEPPDRYESQLVTRARARTRIDAIQEAQFDTLSEIAVTYGDRETFMWGKPGALQFATYRKDREIVASDKIDYWHGVWQDASGGTWRKGQAVWRFELRFHHVVVKEIGMGIDADFKRYVDVADYLGDLWLYGLMRNRLDRSVYIDPFWQFLIEDAKPEQPTGIVVRRVKKSSVGSIGRNVANMIGNMVSLYARQGWNASQVVRAIKRLELWQQILIYYQGKGLDENGITEAIRKTILLRRLAGSAA
ncbi:MAG: hypothetical protein KDH88_19025 [Chromatiales bacterium]|nr:hypothetical protein [Chromatiales bacterium]